MTEEDTTSTEQPADAATAPEAAPEKDWKAEAAKWQALSKKNEERAKANADKAKRLDEIEETSKSETQRLAERAEAAERTAGEATARALRLEVAAVKGLTAKQAARLVGATREELETDADELLASFPAAEPRKPGTPAPDPSQGARGTAGMDLDSRIAEAQKAGDWLTAVSLQNQKMTNTR